MKIRGNSCYKNISHPLGPQDTSPIRANIPSANKMKCSATKPRITSAHNVPHHSCHALSRPESCFRILHKHPLVCKDETFAIPIVLHAAKAIPTRSPSHSIGPISAVRKSYPSRSRPRAYPHPSAQASHGPTACNPPSQITSRRPRGLNWF
jgi:hypothetical protein